MELTETIIYARSKQSSMGQVRQLNLCGYNLSDVSLVSHLKNIEVLALSVNNINSLKPFRHCRNLKELYLRRNKISDVRQLYYLQELPYLRSLWLIENPFCASLGKNYRAVILSILPNLNILDNEPVTQEDVEQSKCIVIESEDENDEPLPLPKVNEAPSIESKPDDAVVSKNRTDVLSSIFPLMKQLDLNGLEILQNNIDVRINEINDEGKKL